MIIGAFYRTPSEREVNQLNQQEKTLDQIYEITKNNESSTIILGGDFNVGDINWDSLTVSNASNNKAHCIKTLEIMAHFHLEQMQRQPTRLDNTLDLWLTNKPSLVRQCNSIPGISNHDIVLNDSDFKAGGAVAEWVERRSLNPEVLGSNPTDAVSNLGQVRLPHVALV